MPWRKSDRLELFLIAIRNSRILRLRLSVASCRDAIYAAALSNIHPPLSLAGHSHGHPPPTSPSPHPPPIFRSPPVHQVPAAAATPAFATARRKTRTGPPLAAQREVSTFAANSCSKRQRRDSGDTRRPSKSKENTENVAPNHQEDDDDSNSRTKIKDFQTSTSTTSRSPQAAPPPGQQFEQRQMASLSENLVAGNLIKDNSTVELSQPFDSQLKQRGGLKQQTQKEDQNEEEQLMTGQQQQQQLHREYMRQFQAAQEKNRQLDFEETVNTHAHFASFSHCHPVVMGGGGERGHGGGEGHLAASFAASVLAGQGIQGYEIMTLPHWVLSELVGGLVRARHPRWSAGPAHLRFRREIQNKVMLQQQNVTAVPAAPANLCSKDNFGGKRRMARPTSRSAVCAGATASGTAVLSADLEVFYEDIESAGQRRRRRRQWSDSSELTKDDDCSFRPRDDDNDDDEDSFRPRDDDNDDDENWSITITREGLEDLENDDDLEAEDDIFLEWCMEDEELDEDDSDPETDPIAEEDDIGNPGNDEKANDCNIGGSDSNDPRKDTTAN